MGKVEFSNYDSILSYFIKLALMLFGNRGRFPLISNSSNFKIINECCV